MFIQCLLESLLLLPFSFSLPPTSQRLFIHKPFLFPAFPFLGKVSISSLLVILCAQLCLTALQNWWMMCFLGPELAFCFSFPVLPAWIIEWNCRNELVLTSTPQQNPSQNYKWPNVQKPLGQVLGLILSNLALSWWKLIGWHLRMWDTGKEKSVGEMSFRPAGDTCETSCDCC